MAGVNTAKVYVGTVEQSLTVGALMRGPVITSIPTTFAEALAAIENFDSCGYLSDTGPTLKHELDLAGIREHNGKVVRQVVNTSDDSLEVELIQTDYDGCCMAFGEGNVTKTNATGDHGEQIRVKLGAGLPGQQAYALRIKDGDMRCICLVPNGQLASSVEVTFAAGEAIKLPATITGLDDGSGGGAYLFFDDGTVATPNVDLAALTVGTLALSPTFSPDRTAYTAATTSSSVNVTAVAVDAGATVTVKNGTTSVSNGGAASLSAGENTITVKVENGTSTEKTYTVVVTKS